MKIAGLAKIVTYVPITISGRTGEEASDRLQEIQGCVANSLPELKNIDISDYQSELEEITTIDDL